MESGLVIKNTGSWYIVKTDGGREIPCKVKGSFRLKGIRSTCPVAIGDRVGIDINNEGSALIREIEDRKNYIIRKSSNLSKQSHILAANVDAALLIVTVSQPETSTVFIDRFLATAEAYSVPAYLVLNKCDLLNDDEREYVQALTRLYESIGYGCYTLSARSGEGIEPIESLIAGKIILMSGHSGVGKSTLINRLIPDSNLRTGEISSIHQTGMHTTTFSEMIPLVGGGYLIDTPGIKGFGTFDLTPAEVTSFFREIFRESANCRFNNCTHRNEPNCAVIKAVEEHRISESRYQSYRSILEDDEEGKYR